MLAYHFTGDTLRDGSPIPPVGHKLIFPGEPILCVQGLHASPHPFDAEQYAPGKWLHLVECGGKIIHGDDKFVCTERTILKTIDSTMLRRNFAADCAEDALHLFEAKYPNDTRPRRAIETARNPDATEEELKVAEAAALAAAGAAARDDAWAAAEAARTAAWAAARDVARTAAWTAAGAAAMSRYRSDFAARVEGAMK